MRAFQRSVRWISPAEILEMVTVNPARALQQENALGRIRPGFRADLIAIPIRGERDLLEKIVGYEGWIDWMMVNGKK